MSDLLAVDTKVTVGPDDGTVPMAATIIEVDPTDDQLPYYVEYENGTRTWATADEVTRA